MFIINVISFVLAIIGAINTGLIGFFNYNLISMVLGGSVTGTYNGSTRVCFAIIGLGGLWVISFFGKAKLFRGGYGCCCKHSNKK